MFLCNQAKFEMAMCQRLAHAAHMDVMFWREQYLSDGPTPFVRLKFLAQMLKAQEEYEAFAFPVIKTLIGE